MSEQHTTKPIRHITTEYLGGALRHSQARTATKRNWYVERDARNRKIRADRRHELTRRILTLLRERSPRTCIELATAIGTTQTDVGNACGACPEIQGAFATAGRRIKSYWLTR